MNFTLIFALAVGLYGLSLLLLRKDGRDESDALLVLVGVGVAIFNWLTTPREYLIYPDALVIAYGRPRVRVIPFGQISGSPEILRLLMGDRLRVRLVKGLALVFQTRDLPTFRDRLAEALNSFRRDHPELGLPDPGPVGQGSR